MFDLHTHTSYSDGRAGPYDLARMAWAAGLTGLAVSDHDTTDHFEEARAACATFGLEWVPAVEFSTEVPSGASVHLLALFVDADSPPLVAELRRLRTAREGRALGMVERLNRHGASLDLAAVLAEADGAVVGRPHVARAMVAAGLVPTVGQAFAEWLGEGRPAYVPKGALDPVGGVQLIRAAGGAAVLAHPTWGGVSAGLLDAMCTAGLAGVESPSEEWEPDAARAWRHIARRRGLVVTHGSDYHGDGLGSALGAVSTPPDTVAALRERAESAVGEWHNHSPCSVEEMSISGRTSKAAHPAAHVRGDQRGAAQGASARGGSRRADRGAPLDL